MFKSKFGAVFAALIVALYVISALSNIMLFDELSASQNGETKLLAVITELLSNLFILISTIGLIALIYIGDKSRIIWFFAFFASFLFIDRLIISIGYLSW